MRNIETKVKVDNLSGLLEGLHLLGANKKETLHQIDTYFNTSQGRLKLREIDGSHYELIYYERPDTESSKISNYEVSKIGVRSVKFLKNILAKTLGIKVIVEKKRELWMYKNTRIHLDEVKNLGFYVELETMVNGDSFLEAREEHDYVAKPIDLSRYYHCKKSYSDILEGNKSIEGKKLIA